MYDGKAYIPKKFMKSLKINPNDYLSLTSFTHQLYYSNFVLNIPDNFSNVSFYNVSLNKLVETINYAQKKGYSIAVY